MYLGLNELPAASTILSCTIWNRTRLTFHALAARICASALLMNSTQFCRVARVIPRTWPGSGYAAQEATGHGRSVNPGGAVNCGGGRSRSHPQAATVATTMATEVVRSRCSRTDASLRVGARRRRSEEHTSELQSRRDLVCRLLLEKKKQNVNRRVHYKNKKNNNRK